MRTRTSFLLAAALGVALVAGGTVTTASAVPDGVHRIGGADRYEVSAAISNDAFPQNTGVPVAYVVSGEVFADALSASALAGLRGGPVLLTAKDAIPASVKAELIRLKPARITVLGGESTISDAVYTALRRLPFFPPVQRIGGADRYEVSANAARDVFGPADVPVSFVASGENFPDALSGAAAAGHLGGPVLLTTKNSVPGPILSELDLEDPGAVRVIGGPNTVSQSVLDTLTRDVQPDTKRIFGPDRYAVSAAVSAESFGAASTVYIASGEVFPDALSGSAAAIALEAPVLLVTKSSIPASVAAELRRLTPTKIVVLGGLNTIDASVEAQLTGFLKP
ncbi:cell wall-binding repeat-containing protein [Herbiconiux sp. P18]|uniref:cell wall-binding repeat-containing protein n=1 Tax=Herbiconiux liangxiaofengii TaxID=3342795 RepID=UPI0035BB6BCC